MRIGIVGAGIAGLACAEGLARRGLDVVLFDKGRGPGGRMSTRRIQTSEGVAHFDHGAQYFTVRDDAFRSVVSDWIAGGVVAAWPAAGADAYVGVPAMNAPVRELAGRHVVHWSARVTTVESRGGGWRLNVAGDDAAHDLDLAVIAIPAEQSAVLLADAAPDLASIAGTAVSQPCWTVMAAFSEPLAVSRDCRVLEGALGWAARNNAKPGRTGPESWVLQATPDWSRTHIDDDPARVISELLTSLSDALGVGLPPTIGTAAHLWRYARSAEGVHPRSGLGADGAILDPDRGLGLCGDWLIGPRVESAWLSGARLAERIGAMGDR